MVVRCGNGFAHARRKNHCWFQADDFVIFMAGVHVLYVANVLVPICALMGVPALK